MMGFPAMNVLDTIIDTLHLQAGGDSKLGHQTHILKHQEPLVDIDFVPPSAPLCSIRTSYIFEDNEAVREQMNKGRTLTMRHVSGTHRVDLDRLHDRINLDPLIQIKHVNQHNTAIGRYSLKRIIHWRQMDTTDTVGDHDSYHTFFQCNLSVSSAVVNTSFFSMSKRAGESNTCAVGVTIRDRQSSTGGVAISAMVALLALS